MALAQRLSTTFRSIFKPRVKADQMAFDNVPMGNIPMGGVVVRPGDLASQLKANRGTFYACSDLIGLGVGDNPLRVYMTLTGREKNNRSYKLLETRELSSTRKDAMIRKAMPGSAVSRAGDLKEVLNGPLVDLLGSVNNYMNAFDSKKLTSVNMDLTGNAYWILIRNMLGIPAAIWFVDSAYMSIIPDKNVWIKGYKYKKGSTEIEYKPEDVVHFKCVSPGNQYYGVAPLMACLDAFNLEEYMMNYETQVFKTGGNPKMIIYTKSQVTKEQGERMKAAFKHIPDGDIAIFYGEDFTLHDLNSPTTRDMGFREGLSFARDRIAMCLHVPKSMLTADNSNRATAIAQQYHLAKYAIAPRCTQIDQKISEHLAPQFNERYVVVFDNPVPEDAEQEREDRKVNIDLGITTRKEERKKMGMGDPEDELLVPVGMIPISAAGSVEENETAERIYELAYLKAKDRRRYERKVKYG